MREEKKMDKSNKEEKRDIFNLKKYKNEIILFLILLSIEIFIFKEFIVGHYTTDSYNLIGIGYIEYLKDNFLPGGRVFSAFLYYISFLLNISYERLFVISLILGLIISIVVVMKLEKICLKTKEISSFWEKLLVLTMSYYTVFNVMYLENLYFAETVIMSLSILFYMLAAEKFSNKEGKYIIKTAVFLSLGVFCYQGTISAFFAFLVLFELLKGKRRVETFKEIFLAGLISLFCILINMIQIKISCVMLQVEQGRIQFNIIDNFILGLEQVIKMFMNIGFYGFYFQIITITFIFAMIYAVKKSKNDMHFWSILIIVIICLGTAIIPTISGTSAIGSARIRFSIGACIGLIYLFLLTKTDIFRYNKIVSVLLSTILIIYGVFNTYTYILNINISKKIDIRDIEETEKILEYIEQYEKDNDIKVENISINMDCENSYKRNIQRFNY